MEIQTETGQLVGWLLVSLVAMVLLAGAIVWVSFASVRRILREEKERFSLLLNHQKELLQSNLLVQEKERVRIAADLHDELASRLNIARMSIQLVKERKALPGKHPESLIDEALGIARRISHELDPPLLSEFGFAEALTDFLQPLQDVISIKLNIMHESASRHFDSEKERQLFRVVQELVNNVLKHAQAKVLVVDLRITDRWAIVRINDDGVGFEVESKRTGAGMRNIESRMQALNGNYRIRSMKNKGTSVLLVVNN